MRQLEAGRLPAATALHRWRQPVEPAVDESSAAAAPVRLRLLATPALLRGDGALVALERKDAALLALLAIDGPTTRPRAAALLWPDADTRGARNNLRQRLFRLRRAAGNDVVDEHAALTLAAGVAHDLASPRAQLEHDPSAVAGELLGGFGYEDCTELDDWVRVARERFRVVRRDALAAAAAEEESGGRVARALMFAERLVSDEPLSEQAHRLLMRLHYRRGDRSAALAAYTRCERWLRKELDAAPSGETRALAQLIERAGELPGTVRRRIPAALARPPVLVGREPQWRALEDAWECRRVGVLIGDAGMGKSRLLGDFAKRCGVPLVGARPGDERVPYALLARLLREVLLPGSARDTPALGDEVRSELARVLPELGSAPREAMNDARFRQAVTHVLALHGGAGFALDDLHFADPASLELLPTLVAPELHFVLAVRGAEMPPALAAWQRVAGGDLLVDILLPPLAEADVRKLLETLALDGVDAATLAGPLARHTGGNPYFVLETLGALLIRADAMGARLPTAPTVSALIERRLTQLSPPALRLARVAALADADFDAALAAHVLGAHPLDFADAWFELERANVLVGNVFAHDLVRDVVACAIPAPIGELLHRGVAEFLEGQNAPPARVAKHYADAGAWLQAADFHMRAAEVARRKSRRVEEVEQREAAISCFDRAGDVAAAFDARYSSIESLILVRGVEQAQNVIEGMLAVARSDTQRAAALTARANASLMAADHVSGVASAREALRLADGLDQPWLRFEAARLLAVGLSQQGSVEEGEAVLAPYEAQVESDGTPEQRGRYWSDLAYVLNSARHLRRTAEALSHAIECARELGDLAELAMLTTNLATLHGNLGHIDEAYEQALRARALHLEVGRTGGPIGGVIEAHVGLYGTGRGQYSTALQAYDSALDCFRRDGQSLWIAVCSNNLAMTLIDLGQFTRARQALAYPMPSVTHVAARGAVLSARIDRMLGASPLAQLRRAAAELARGDDYYLGALLELERAETLEARRALPACDAVAQAAEQREYGGIAMKARLLAARAALRAGDAEQACARWNAAERALKTLQPADFYPLTTAVIGLDILVAVSERQRADDLLEEALAWLHGTALPQVPEAFRDGFLHRNPVNRALLAAEGRLR